MTPYFDFAQDSLSSSSCPSLIINCSPFTLKSILVLTVNDKDYTCLKLYFLERTDLRKPLDKGKRQESEASEKKRRLEIGLVLEIKG